MAPLAIQRPSSPCTPARLAADRRFTGAGACRPLYALQPHSLGRHPGRRWRLHCAHVERLLDRNPGRWGHGALGDRPVPAGPWTSLGSHVLPSSMKANFTGDEDPTCS